MSAGSAAQPRVALVSGAARGIGAAIARQLAREGYTTVGIDVGELEQTGLPAAERYELLHGDVADETAVAAIVESVSERHGAIDVLVNVAGVVVVKPLIETTWDEFRCLVEVNLGGTFLLCKHVIPHMQARRRGVIVNLGSVSGHVGQVDHALYGASKGAVIALGRALAWELAPSGIRVATVSPGSVDTAMLRSDIQLEADRTGGTFEDTKRKREGEQALGRWADPAEIAEAVCFLASDRASFITGADLLVDCGWVAR